MSLLDEHELTEELARAGVDERLVRGLVILARVINRSVEERDRREAYSEAMKGYPG